MPDSLEMNTDKLDDELDKSVTEGGLIFCGQNAAKFAINGTRYAWPKNLGAPLKWAIDFSRLGTLGGADCKEAATAWFSEISAACGLDFTYTSNPKTANLLYVSKRLDGPSGVLAQMDLPVGNVSLDSQMVCQMDDGENWLLSESQVQGGIDFFRVGLHETLHGVGFGHEPVSIKDPSIEAPIYNWAIRHLQVIDKKELVIRYGERVVVPSDPVIPAPVPGSTPIILESTQILTQGAKKWQAKTTTTLTRVV